MQPYRLEKSAGLPLTITGDDFSFLPDPTVRCDGRTIRTWTEMKNFVHGEGVTATREELYYMFRNVSRVADQAVIASAKLRYDVTVIAPGFFVSPLQKEYIRTIGHYHPVKPGTVVPYPEIYEVIYGRAYFLLQRADLKYTNVISEIYVVEAHAGEKVIMPPTFGHLTVNATNEPLVLANIVEGSFATDYAHHQTLQGAGYWIIEGFMDNTIEFKKNINYDSVVEIKKLRPREIPEFAITWKEPLYQSVADIEKLLFLTSPELFLEHLAIDNCFYMF